MNEPVRDALDRVDWVPLDPVPMERGLAEAIRAMTMDDTDMAVFGATLPTDPAERNAMCGHLIFLTRLAVGYLAVAMDVPYAVAAEALAAASTRHQGPAVRAAQG